MRLLTTRTHGLLDYIVSLLLIASPWLFGFAGGGPETKVPVALGTASVLYSLLTRYEGGVVRVVPFPVHLTFDFLSGGLLLLSPWLAGFSGRVMWPHVLFGLLEIGVAAITQRTPGVAAIRRD